MSFSFIQTLRSLKDIPLHIQNLTQLHNFQNRHLGQRCFIIGNGPSLKQMDLSPLQHEITFGLNRIYLLFPQIGFSTTFLVAINKFVMEQFGSELVNVPSIKFMNWYYRTSMPVKKDTIFVRPGQKPRFSMNPVSQPVWEGATVTYVAMQLAYFMGFSKVILVGVDHSFCTEGDPNKLITSEGEDTNHFSPNYFGKGVHWQLPDLKTSEVAYKLAKQCFENDHRQILDATVNGKLEIFTKVDYSKLF